LISFRPANPDEDTFGDLQERLKKADDVLQAVPDPNHHDYDTGIGK